MLPARSVATPLAALTWEPVSTTAWLLMLSLGLVFGLAQFLLIQAFAHAPAGVLAPFAYAQIVSATIVGFIFFDAVPNVWTLLGVTMTVAAGVSWHDCRQLTCFLETISLEAGRTRPKSSYF